MASGRPGAAHTKRSLARPTWGDVSSGFVTGLFSLPEGMAYASIGGFAAPLGLWSGVVPTMVGSMLARTVLMVTTLTSAIALSARSVLDAAGLDPGDVGAVASLTVLVGVIMLVLGVLRLGSVMRFVSTAVMTGFTTGIAIQIVAGVIGDATGYSPAAHNTVGKLLEAATHVSDWDPATVAVALGTVAVWALCRRVARLRSLATLVALLVASLAAFALADGVERVSDIAAVPRSLPPFTLPDASAMPALATGAVAVALVALAQAAGIGAAVANPDGSRSDASRDFVAQGAANLAGGLFGALPTGGSLSRTGIATSAGARTRWAGVFAGLSLGLIVLAVGPLAGEIPMAVIGGLMLIIGAELVGGRMADIRLVARTSTASLAAMAVTFVATTALPLQQAIFIGAALSILLTAIQNSRAGGLVALEPEPSGDWRVVDPPAVLPSHATTVLHYTGTGFFAEVGGLDDVWPDSSAATDAALVISTRGALGVPSATFLKMLDRRVVEMRGHGVGLVVCGVAPRLRELLERTGALETLGPENVLAATPALMESLQVARERAEELRGELLAAQVAAHQEEELP